MWVELYSVTEPAPFVSAAPLETRSELSAGTVTQSSSSTPELPAQKNEETPPASPVPAVKEPASSAVQAVRSGRTEHTATVTQSSSSTSGLPAQKNEDLPLTVEVHHAVLCEILKLHATKWREIGQHLGFLPGTLTTSKQLHCSCKQLQWAGMNAVLEKFLKEREGGAKMSVLEAALNKAGLGVTASQLRDDVQRLLAQGIVVTF